jgi:hypothetical protein
MNIEAKAELHCHRTTPCEDVRAFHVHARRTRTALELDFRLDGKISCICLPPPSGPPDFVELWRHTCFEVFIATEGRAAYHEFNFAPSREWRAYAFRAYRDLDPAPPAYKSRSPILAARATDNRFELDVRVILGDLSPAHSNSPLRVGASAVIELRNGSLCYWALHHPVGKPDFHHADTFALRLEAPPRK